MAGLRPRGPTFFPGASPKLLSYKYGTWLYLPESATLTFYECQHNEHNEGDDGNKTLGNSSREKYYSL